jgi:hypothetical protein
MSPRWVAGSNAALLPWRVHPTCLQQHVPGCLAAADCQQELLQQLLARLLMASGAGSCLACHAARPSVPPHPHPGPGQPLSCAARCAAYTLSGTHHTRQRLTLPAPAACRLLSTWPRRQRWCVCALPRACVRLQHRRLARSWHR